MILRKTAIFAVVVILLAYGAIQATIAPERSESREVFEQLPAGIKAGRVFGHSVWKNGVKFKIQSFRMKKTMPIILDRMGSDYLRKLRKRHDREGYYSAWNTRGTTVNSFAKAPLAVAALELSGALCEEKPGHYKDLCRSLKNRKSLYAFSQKGVAMLSAEDNKIVVIFVMDGN